MAIQAERMVGDLETFGAGNVLLAALNFGVEEFLDPAAIEAHQMVVVLTFIDLVDRLARLEVAAVEQAGLLELRQHPVHRGQTDVGAVFEQHPEDIFSGHVALLAGLEDFKNLQPRQRRLQARALQFIDVAHGFSRGFSGIARG